MRGPRVFLAVAAIAPLLTCEKFENGANPDEAFSASIDSADTAVEVGDTLRAYGSIGRIGAIPDSIAPLYLWEGFGPVVLVPGGEAEAAFFVRDTGKIEIRMRAVLGRDTSRPAAVQAHAFDLVPAWKIGPQSLSILENDTVALAPPESLALVLDSLKSKVLWISPGGGALIGGNSLSCRFVPEGMGTYLVSLLIVNGKVERRYLDVVVKVGERQKPKLPTPDTLIEAKVGEKVVLEGKSGLDPADTVGLVYTWTVLTSGKLENPASATPVYVADRPGVHAIFLTVKKNGKTGDALLIKINVVEKPALVAVPGNGAIAHPGEAVKLDGKLSEIASSGPVGYSWRAPGADLMQADSAEAIFRSDSIGSFWAYLTVVRGTDSSREAGVRIEVVPWGPPTAVITGDSVIALGDTARLDGGRSVSPGGSSLAFAWAAEPGGELLDTGSRVRFTASRAGAYLVSLKVRSGGQTSLPGYRKVTVSGDPADFTSKLAADAGGKVSTLVDSGVRLGGSVHGEKDGVPVEFVWQPVSGGELDSDLVAKPVFRASQAGTYPVALRVIQGQDTSLPDFALIEVKGYGAPTANAGPDKSTSVGKTVKLDGAESHSNSPRGLVYSWTSSEPGLLSDTSAAQPAFKSSKSGTFPVSLTVSDGFKTAYDWMFVTVAGRPIPLADAGEDLGAVAEVPIALAGAADGADEGPFLFSWKALNGGTLEKAETSAPLFTAREPGRYVVSLMVTQDGIASDLDFVVVTVADPGRPKADAGGDRTAIAGVPLRIEGGRSQPYRGGSLAYSWYVSSGATLSDSSSAAPAFLAAETGEYFLILVVRENGKESLPDHARIKVTENGDTVRPANVGGLSARESGPGAISLSWEPSGSSDAESVFVFYRDDGRFPMAPGDGIPAVALGDTATGTLLSGLDPLKPYAFAAFVLDTAGNFSAPTASARAAVNRTPNADAGRDTVLPFTGRTSLRLDGTRSFDAEGGIRSYSWTGVKTNPEEVVVEDSSRPLIELTKPGQYVFMLTVFDGEKVSRPSQVRVTLLAPDVVVSKTLEPGPYRLFRTLREGLAAAAPGDTIFVDKGIYSENDTARVPRLYIFSADTTAVINGENRGCGLTLEGDAVEGIRIRNLRFIQGGRTDSNREIDVAGLLVKDARSIQVENCSFDNNRGDGVRLYNSQQIFFLNCRISRNDYNGIRATNSSFTVTGSVLSGNGVRSTDGNVSSISLESLPTLPNRHETSPTQLIGNRFETVLNGRSIGVYSTYHVEIEGNRFETRAEPGGVRRITETIQCTEGSQATITLRGNRFIQGYPVNSVSCLAARSIRIMANRFENGVDGQHKALDLTRCLAGEFTGDTVVSFPVGLRLSASPLTISQSFFQDNRVAIRDSSRASTLGSGNIFLGNTTDIEPPR